jgi:hypothetical protein
VSLSAKLSQCRTALVAQYPGYNGLPDSERVLLAMAYLCDTLKVREVGGNNRGEWVGALQAAAGIGAGDPWCAAAVTFAAMVAGAPRPERPDDNPAAVIGWRRWLSKRDAITTAPKRGSICMHQTTASQGHIGVVVRVVGPLVYSIEGNTSSGSEGSQRDGGGLYRRVRSRSFWSWGFGEIK